MPDFTSLYTESYLLRLMLLRKGRHTRMGLTVMLHPTSPPEVPVQPYHQLEHVRGPKTGLRVIKFRGDAR